jgi:O-acetyl-ADP-ribose deacetylase (regulator of RNase III)
MIERVTGNLLAAEVDALVNSVNCVGVMGKGIALQFKQAFPSAFQAYRKACSAHEVQPGRMFVWNLGEAGRPRFIIHFPTK